MGFGSWFQDNVVDPAKDFGEAVFEGDFSQVLEDIGKGLLGLATLGLSNRDDLFSPDDDISSAGAYEDRKSSTRNAIAEREIVYGRVKKGGTIVYVEPSGENNRYLHLVYVLASHQCERIEEVYFGDELAATYASSGTTESFDIIEQYSEKLTIAGMLSSFGGAAEINGMMPDSWTSQHALSGCCVLYMRLDYDRDVYRNGVPRVSVIMRGKNDIYDPRTTSTGYTTNAALVALDYLRTINGMAVPDADIDMQSFIDAANYADDSVYQYTQGSYEPRYSASGIAKVNTKPFRNMEAILRSSGSLLAYTVGQWRLIRSEFVAPTLTLTQDDLVGGLALKPSAGRSARLNRIKGIFVNQDTWERADYPAMQVDSYVSSDGELFEDQLDLAYVTSAYQAQRLAKLLIERSRYGITVTATFKFKALQLTVGDRVYLDIEQLGIATRAFMVHEMELDISSGIKLVLREDVAEVYAWHEDDNKAVLAPPSINVPSADPVAPTGFTVGEELYQTTQSNVIKVRALLSWSDPVGRTQSYDLQYRELGGQWKWVGSSIFGTTAAIDDIKPDDYEFRIRPLNELTWVGDWATYSNEILGKAEPPSKVDTLFLTGSKLSWSFPSAPLDLAGYVLKYHAGDRQTWSDALAAHTGILTSSPFDASNFVNSETTFLLKAIDTSGKESADAAILVTNIGGSAVDQNAVLEKAWSTDFADFTNVVKSNGSFSGSVFTADTVGGFYNSDPDSPFYNPDANADFYSTEYERVEVWTTISVDPADVGYRFELSVDTNATGATLEYTEGSRPLENGEPVFTPFSGVIEQLTDTSYTFRIVIPSQLKNVATTINDVSYTIDVPDLVEVLQDRSIGPSATALTINKTFREITHVSLTLQDDNSGAVAVKLINKSTAGPQVQAFNASGTAVSTTIDAFIRGY